MSSISSQLLTPPTYRYPSIRSGFEWSSFGLDSLATEKFYNFREAKARHNLRVYAGGPHDSEQEKSKYIEGIFNGAIFNTLEAEDNTLDFTKIVTDIRLFISHDGAYLLQQHKSLQVAKNQLAIFVEIPDRDIFSNQTLLIKAGENALKYAETTLQHYMKLEYFTLTSEQTKLLLSSAESGKMLWNQIVTFSIDNISDKVIDTVIDLSILALHELISFLNNNLRIEENQWNLSTEEYTLEKLERQLVNFLKEQETKLTQLLEKYPNLPQGFQKMIATMTNHLSGARQLIEVHKEKVQQLWAFFCGLWNGLVDLISGLLGLIKLIFQAIEYNRMYNRNKQYYKQLACEKIDNLWQAIADINWKEWMETSWNAAIKFKEEVEEKIEALDLNTTEINYYSGYLVFSIFEWAFPILKLGKTNKTEKVIDTLEELVREITKNTQKGVKEGRDAADTFFKNSDEVLEALKKENEVLKKQIEETFTLARTEVEEASKSKAEKIIDNVKTKKERLDVNAKGQKRKISDNTRHSNFAEMVANQKWMNIKIWSNGKKVQYEPLHLLIDDLDVPIRKGIDGIFENKLYNGTQPPPKYVINEVKYNTLDTVRTPNVWKNKLNPTKHGKQMGDKWIEKNLREGFGRTKALDIQNNSQKMITGVSKNGNKLEIFELSNNATKIKALNI